VWAAACSSPVDAPGSSVPGSCQSEAPVISPQKTDVLFVIVRRPGSAPRPLAAKRIDHPQFPVAFEITKKDMMIEGSELRGMVDVIARLDKDGVAGPAQPGDLEGRFEKNPTLPGSANVEIVIDKAY